MLIGFTWRKTSRPWFAFTAPMLEFKGERKVFKIIKPQSKKNAYGISSLALPMKGPKISPRNMTETRGSTSNQTSPSLNSPNLVIISRLIKALSTKP